MNVKVKGQKLGPQNLARTLWLIVGWNGRRRARKGSLLRGTPTLSGPTRPPGLGLTVNILCQNYSDLEIIRNWPPKEIGRKGTTEPLGPEWHNRGLLRAEARSRGT